MHRRATFLLGFLTLAAASTPALAQDVRFYEEDGVTFKETKQTVRRQIPQVQYHESERTVLRSQTKTEMQDVVRTYQVPVTEYRWESYWKGRYNPFSQPELAHRQVPYTRWETRTEISKVPVTRVETVPEKTPVKVGITTWRTVEEHVTSRVAMGARPVGAAAIASSNSPPGSTNVGSQLGNLPAPPAGADMTNQASMPGTTTQRHR